MQVCVRGMQVCVSALQMCVTHTFKKGKPKQMQAYRHMFHYHTQKKKKCAQMRVRRICVGHAARQPAEQKGKKKKGNEM
jgi:hypothetical protein